MGMWGYKRKSAIAALCMAALSAAPASAACWTAAEVDAAKVRELETMLMVNALRCRHSGEDFLGSYNHFVREGRVALTRVNETLRGHFAASGTGLNGYDRYVTALANRHGAGGTGLDCGDFKSILSAARAEKGSMSGLVRLANDAQVRAHMPGGQCGMQVARAK
jgi:hypothetical protein